jgi:hypothetical protein
MNMALDLAEEAFKAGRYAFVLSLLLSDLKDITENSENLTDNSTALPSPAQTEELRARALCIRALLKLGRGKDALALILMDTKRGLWTFPNGTLAQAEVSEHFWGLKAERDILSLALRNFPSDIDLLEHVINNALRREDHWEHTLWVNYRRLLAGDGITEIRNGFAQPMRPPRLDGSPKRVAFVSSLVRAREACLAEGVRSQGGTALLFCAGTIQVDENIFDAIEYHSIPSDLVRKVNEADVDVVHALSVWSNHLALMLLAGSLRPVVFDNYDFLTEQVSEARLNLQRVDLSQPLLERIMVAQADGQCCRNLHSQPFKRSYPVKGPRRLIPEFLSTPLGQADRLPPLSGDQNGQDAPLHLVYGGTVLPESVYGFGEGYLDIAKAITAQGHHCHLYILNGYESDGTFKSDFHVYADEAAVNPRLHLHPPQFGQDWIRELSQYDAGISLSSSWYSDINSAHQSEETIRYQMSSKVVNFLAARLPVLGNREILTFWLMRNTGWFVNARTPSDFANPETWKALRAAKKGADTRPFPTRYTLPYQAPRLMDLYHQTIVSQEGEGKNQGDRSQ